MAMVRLDDRRICAFKPRKSAYDIRDHELKRGCAPRRGVGVLAPAHVQRRQNKPDDEGTRYKVGEPQRQPPG